MLISAGKVTPDVAETYVLSSSTHEIFWRGLVYKDSLPAGAASLRELTEVPEHDIPGAAAQLKGIYFIVLRYKTSDNCYAFVDNAGLYHAYYSQRQIGTSFLELMRDERCTPKDLDSDALVEFFHFGCIYSDKTMFREIRKIEPTAVLRLGPSGSVEALPKPVPDIAIPSEYFFEPLLRSFAAAVAGERVSMDITGGVDSRLLAVALSYFGLPFELAASGILGITDLKIAEEVARALGCDFYPTYHDAERCDWDQLVQWSDAMFDVSKNSRLMQLQQDRKKRGVTLSVSGAGGELYKDFWWLQDFPFYTRHAPRLATLYSVRIAPQNLQHSYLAEPYRALSRRYRHNLLDMFLQHYIVASNTHTYDRIYYYFKMRGFAGRFITSSMPILKIGAPYLDSDAVRIGYALPRSQRFFNRFHRKMITQYSPPLSLLRTTEGGMTVSSGATAISLDLAKYATDRCKRIAKKIGERLLAKSFFQESSDDPRMPHELRRLLAARRTTERLADHGVLSAALDVQALPQRYLGSLFVLGHFFEELEQNARPLVAETRAAAAD